MIAEYEMYEWWMNAPEKDVVLETIDEIVQVEESKKQSEDINGLIIL